MANIAHPEIVRNLTTADHLWTLALCAAYRCARARYPQTERMVKGFVIANAGKVTLLDGGSARVASQFGTTCYEVNGACPCPDYARAPEKRCKHRWSVALAKKAHALLAAAAAAALDAPGDLCPACGEATVVDVAVWGKRTQTYLQVRQCRMVLDANGERSACGWWELAR